MLKQDGSVETIDKWKKNRVLGYIGYFENQGNAFYKVDKTSMMDPDYKKPRGFGINYKFI